MDIDASLDPELEISRYMSFAKFASLLSSGQLFFASLASFADDPHEGSGTEINRANDTGLFDALHAFVHKTLPASLGVDVSPEDRARLRAEAEQEMNAARHVDSAVFGKLLLSPLMTYEQALRLQRNWLDASCWHEGVDESLAMWKIYGGSTEAVCITSTVKRLAASLRLTSEEFGYVGRVRYIDHREEYFEGENPLDPALHKRRPFAYEKEIRALVWERCADVTAVRIAAGRSVNVDLPSLVTRVRLSPMAAPWFQSLVQQTMHGALDAPLDRSNLDTEPIL
jgi:hypothetical protein